MATLNEDITELINCTNVNDFLTYLPNNNMINLLCLHINIRSLIKNFSALEQCIINSKTCIDVVIVTEANISEGISCLYQIDGYRMHTALRGARRGGGIVLYINNKHKCIIKKYKSLHFENILFTITTQSRYSAVLCAIYRPPSCSKNLFITELETTLRNVDVKNHDLFLLGDMNIDLKSDKPLTHKYINMLSEFGLVGGISEHTRIEFHKGKLTKSCIDHIYARSRTQDLFTAALGSTLADHRAVALACTGVRVQHVPKYKTCTDNKKLFKLLQDVPWGESRTLECPLDLYDHIYTRFEKCYVQSQYQIKIKNKLTRGNNDWVSKNIIKACDYRDKLFTEWIKQPYDMIRKQNYNKARNYANVLIRKTKNNSIKNEILDSKGNMRKLWQILNKLTGRINRSIDETIINAFQKQNITCKDIANNFARRFSSSVKDIIPKCSNPLLDQINYKRPSNVSMRFKPADPDSVKKIIMSMNSNKAPGIDGIRLIDLKHICDKIKHVICKIINRCVQIGKYPPRLKTGIIRPIYKKGCHDDYNNYRPITILPTIDKVAEKFISKQIYDFYDKNKTLSDKQFGFQQNKNTTQLLSAFTDVIYNHLDKKRHVLIVFIDYSKAFDTLRHDRLLDCLDDSGIRGSLLSWCEDYLKNRKFIVKISDSVSESVAVTEGTAQGSVIGPLHYLTYVNNLETIIKNTEMFQFADDTCLIAANICIVEAQNQLQKDFDLLAKWSHDAGLVLNASKTKLMYVSSSQNRSTYKPKLLAHSHDCLHINNKLANAAHCDCETLEVVNKQTYLGLIIDNRFTWKEHINHVCIKLRAILAKFSIMKQKIPYQTLLMMYKSLAESIISYGLSSYGRTYKTHLDLVYKLQIRLLKQIVPYNINKYKNNCHELFGFCKILPIYEKIKLSLLTEEYFNEGLKVRKTVNKHDVITRSISSCKLLLPTYTNLYGMRSLKYIIPNLINELPKLIKDKLNESNIKINLKKYFLENQSPL